MLEKIKSRWRGLRHGAERHGGIDSFVAKKFYTCTSCLTMYNAVEDLGLRGDQPSDSVEFHCECGTVNRITLERETRW